ncbi:hypothetical protein [Brachybacterium sp. 107]|uniref:hypothetical protein n=1 Tax=Brachybacterium sp. 107 TaxID=3457736 RepID=UPI0040342AF5
MRGSADVDLAGDEAVPTATADSTLAEIAQILGGREKLGALFGENSLFQDPEMQKIGEQIPVGRFAGLAGVSREQLQDFLDAVNAC